MTTAPESDNFSLLPLLSRYYIPAGFPLGLLTFILLLAGFNFLRASKPECWLKNRMDAVGDWWTHFRPPINEEFGQTDWIKKRGK